MHEFICGHQECGSQLTSSKRETLMAQVVDHLEEVHNVQKATQTLLSYLEATCVRSAPSR